jgi:hypothetical protein
VTERLRKLRNLYPSPYVEQDNMDGTSDQVPCNLHNWFLASHISTLKMEAEYWSETFVSTYKTIRCHSLEHNLGVSKFTDAVTLLTRVPEVHGSNPGSNIGYPD